MEDIKEYIEDGNKTIARFMGYDYFPFNAEEKKEGKEFGWLRTQTPNTIQMQIGSFFLARKTRDLRYFNSWDWLMPVVEKLEQKSSISIYETATEVIYPKKGEIDYIEVSMGTKKIHHVHKAVVRIINYLNEKEK